MTTAASTQGTRHSFVQYRQPSSPAMPASISFTNAWLGGFPFLACCTHTSQSAQHMSVDMQARTN